MLPKLTHEKLSEIVTQCRDKFMADNGYSNPAQINDGDCEDFALFVVMRVQEIDDGVYEYDDVQVVWDNEILGVAFEDSPWPAHAFLMWNSPAAGRAIYFDSEQTWGVGAWQGLPIFKRWRERYEPSTLQPAQADS